MSFTLKSGNTTPFKMMGSSPLRKGNRVDAIKAEYKETKPVRPKGELVRTNYLGGEHEVARTKVSKEDRKQYRAEKKDWRRRRKYEIKQYKSKHKGEGWKDLKREVKRRIDVVGGKKRPKGWCPKGGTCGSGPRVQRPSLARRLWPFGGLREGGSK